MDGWENKMEKIDYVKLTNYTCMSIGLDTPEQLVEKAASGGTSALVITDFNSVQAFPRAAQAIEKQESKPPI